MQQVAYDSITRLLSRFLAISVLGLAISVLPGCEDSPQESKKTADTKAVSWPRRTLGAEDSTPRDFYDAKIGSRRFLIPTDLVRERNSTREYVELMMEWPGLQPLNTTPETFTHVYDLVYLRLKPDPGGLGRETVDLLRDDIGRGWVAEPRLSLEFDSIIEYEPTAGLSAWYFQPTNNFTKTPNGSMLTARCTDGLRRSGNKRDLICVAAYQIGGNVRVEYHFHEQYLADWKKIHTDLQQLISKMQELHDSLG